METTIAVNGETAFDCIVCGGGMSGIAAAVTAARNGLKTALVEQSGALGGVAVNSGINHLLGGRYYNKKTGRVERKIGGVFDELTDRLISIGGAIEPDTIDVQNNPHGWYPRMAAGIPFDGNRMKLFLDTICLEEGIEPYLQTRIISLQRYEKRVVSLTAHNKSGLFSLRGDVIIDATGDADIAAMAGCSYQKGREEDGLMTPASLEFHVDQVDREALLAYQNEHQSPKLVEIIEDLKHKGIWDFPFEIFVTVQLNEPDVFLVNTLRQTGVDGTDGKDITRGLIEGRRDVYKLHDIMKKYFPGFSSSRVRYIGESLGIRETRRINDLAHVSIEDAASGKTYEDCVARTTYNFDLPDPKKPSHDPMMGDAKKPNAERKHLAIEVPYGVMVPDEVENLIVTGRAVSVDREVLGALRVMGPCMLLGQAAGTAAAAAFREEIPFAEVDGKIVRSRLIDAGCLLGEL